MLHRACASAARTAVSAPRHCRVPALSVSRTLSLALTAAAAASSALPLNHTAAFLSSTGVCSMATTASSAGCPVVVPATMRAVEAAAGRCVVNAARPVPTPGPKELLVKVHYTAINRADTLQRKGKYPPPAGVTDILGLEMVGEVVAAGAEVAPGPASSVGARVMALLGGGGNAEYAVVRADHVMPVPEGMSYREAAAVPETWLTAYQLLFLVGDAKPEDTVLIHAAASGVGTAAVQLAKRAGCKVIAVAGRDDKLDVVRGLGADAGVNYKALEGAFAPAVVEAAKALNGPACAGVSLVLDPVGASFWRANTEALAPDGRWVLYGSMGGVNIEGGLFAAILGKRLQIRGSTLRARPDAYKAALVAAFAADALPGLASGGLRPIVDREYPLEDIQAAHEYMESNESIGKIVIKVAAD